MLLRTVTPASVLPAALLSECSGDDDGCSGTSYDVDRSEQGAASTSDALGAWLADPVGFDQLPPKDACIVQGGGGETDAERVVILDEDTGDGWWVHLVRTDAGRYVVDEATDHWRSCQDELS